MNDLWCIQVIHIHKYIEQNNILHMKRQEQYYIAWKMEAVLLIKWRYWMYKICIASEEEAYEYDGGREFRGWCLLSTTNSVLYS